MFLTITIPANLYPAVVHSIVEHFEDFQPDRALAAEELSDDKLRSMRGSFAGLCEIAAVLDQLSWTTIPREPRITAEGRLLRSILTTAIDSSLTAFTRALGPTSTPTCDLDQFQLLNDQVGGLLALLRTVQHDPDATTGAPS